MACSTAQHPRESRRATQLSAFLPLVTLSILCSGSCFGLSVAVAVTGPLECEDPRSDCHLTFDEWRSRASGIGQIHSALPQQQRATPGRLQEKSQALTAAHQSITLERANARSSARRNLLQGPGTTGSLNTYLNALLGRTFPSPQVPPPPPPPPAPNSPARRSKRRQHHSENCWIKSVQPLRSSAQALLHQQALWHMASSQAQTPLDHRLLMRP
ncbi:hypothetical protein WJX73_006758 [Symbiochloris irregularis]|uniref:Uncharacterized protein n=1 Tax=Symbiochloris irregularis TaxID=706552 RepID=A0AAW1NQR6_9CHLO